MKYTYSAGDQPLPGYTVQRGLGRGGFGEVYQAVSDGGKEVALKVVQRHLNVELRGVTQCLNLKHPNLLALYDVRQTDGGDHWVVMEYVAGGSLDHVLARNRQGLPVEEALAWLFGVCGGVAYLHERGIVHRDLKPGNIFIESGLVKIGDYGLSKFISASRRSGQTESVGTVHYMAPEIAKGRYGKELDLYALGIILYEMLTGRVPFEGESPGEILMKHLTADPDLAAVPEAFRPVIARLLDKDPAKRYPSVEALLEDIHAACRTANVTARTKPSMYIEPAREKLPGFETAAYLTGRPITAEVVRQGPGPGTVMAQAGGRVVRAAWHATRRVCWRDWFRQHLAVFVRIALAAFIGTGCGLLSAGVFVMLWHSPWPYNDAPAFFGAGLGNFIGAFSAWLFLRSFREFIWWRPIVAAAFAVGVAFSLAAVTSRFVHPWSDAPALIAVGSGLLTFGAAVYFLLLRRPAEPPARDTSSVGRTAYPSSVRSSRSGVRGSIEARPILWSLFLFFSLAMLVIASYIVRVIDYGSALTPSETIPHVVGGLGLSLLASIVFCFGAFLMRTIPAPDSLPPPAEMAEKQV